MAVYWEDFVFHTKRSGNKIKKFRCTCDKCGCDRGYQPKAKTMKLCWRCTIDLPEVRERIRSVRSTEESRSKTIAAHDKRWTESRKRKEEDRSHKRSNPSWWRTQEWKDKISRGLLARDDRTPHNKGQSPSLESRIKSSCSHRKIAVDEFDGFTKDSVRQRLKHNISARLYHALRVRSIRKGGLPTLSILGIDIDALKEHLEARFYRHPIIGEEMSWENYGRGGWVIDHVVPDSWFSYTSVDDEGFKKSWSIENLQPMWEYENLIKNNRYSGGGFSDMIADDGIGETYETEP